MESKSKLISKRGKTNGRETLKEMSLFIRKKKQILHLSEWTRSVKHLQPLLERMWTRRNTHYGPIPGGTANLCRYSGNQCGGSSGRWEVISFSSQLKDS